MAWCSLESSLLTGAVALAAVLVFQDAGRYIGLIYPGITWTASEQRTLSLAPY